MILQLIHKLFGSGHNDDCDLSVIATQAPTTEGSQSDKHRVLTCDYTNPLIDYTTLILFLLLKPVPLGFSNVSSSAIAI